MNKKQEELYILIREDDQKNLKNTKYDCFSLVPILVKKKGINLIFPNPLKTYKNSKKQLLSCEEIIKGINQIVNKKIPETERVLTAELLKPFLDTKISIYLYLRDCIPEYNVYNLFIDGRWIKFNSISKLIIGIEKEHAKEEGNISFYLEKYTNIKYNLVHKLLANFQVFVIHKLINKKNLYILSGKKFYFMPIIFDELSIRRKNILAYNQTQQIIKIIFIIINQLSSLIFESGNINNEFFMIPNNISESKRIKVFNKRIKYQCNFIEDQYLNYVLQEVENYLNINYGYKSYSKKIFGDSSINYFKAIFHTNRFPDLNSLSRNLSQLNGDTHLITHGTHTLQNKSEIISESLEIGMLKTNIPKIKMYSQSIFSDDYLINKKISFTKIKPIKSIKINNKKIKSQALNILYAGTIKQLGARRYYFESCFEYLYSTLELCKKLRKLEFDILLTIRIRNVKNEINFQIIQELIKDFNEFVRVSKNKNFEDDLANSDCLIALSSTTLEEAINSQVPSMSYGLSAYNHFDSYLDQKYRINRKVKNYDKLKKIEKILKRKFTYLEENMLYREKNIFDCII